MARPSSDKRILSLLGPFSPIARRVKSTLSTWFPRIPMAFEAAFAERLAAWPASGHPWNARESQLYLLSVSRALLLAATGVGKISQVRFACPDFVPPLDWLDELARDETVSALEAVVHRNLIESSELFGADPLRILQEAYLPPGVRKKRGEHFTPEWLADLVLDWAGNEGAAVLDPTAGGGAFALAVARRCRREKGPFPDFVGMESDPATFVACAASIAWGRRIVEGRRPPSPSVPLLWTDILAGDARPPRRFDMIIGNPPWVLWDRYSSLERQSLATLWKNYGLQTETGMRSILGGGKRDVAALIALVAADRWLADKGRLCFVVPISLFKSSTSARGFRRLELPDGTGLSVEVVHDMAGLPVFPNASVRPAVVCLTKGASTRYPVRYVVWNKGDVKRECLAAPSDLADRMSSWRHRPIGAKSDLAVMGPSDYVAHLGVNTGGANGVYWFRRLPGLSTGHWRMANLGSRGKSEVVSKDIELEPDFFHPALLGRDVQAWKAVPSAWILMVQDPCRRRGVEESSLAQRAPRCLQYLRSHEALLRHRAAFRRYFTRLQADGSIVETGPFYSMFNVGGYTMSPWKVVWNRMGHQMAAAVVGSFEGRLVLPQETHAFIGVENEREAYYLAALFNSRPVQESLESFACVGAKSFATPGIIHRLRLRKFRPDDPLHQQLALFGELATRQGKCGAIAADVLSGLDAAATEYWS